MGEVMDGEEKEAMEELEANMQRLEESLELLLEVDE